MFMLFVKLFNNFGFNKQWNAINWTVNSILFFVSLTVCVSIAWLYIMELVWMYVLLCFVIGEMNSWLIDWLILNVQLFCGNMGNVYNHVSQGWTCFTCTSAWPSQHLRTLGQFAVNQIDKQPVLCTGVLCFGTMNTWDLLVFHWLFRGTWIDMNLRILHSDQLIDFHQYLIYNNYLINK